GRARPAAGAVGAFGALMGAHPGRPRGLRILEFGALGPVPFCGMLFSDLGADVLRIDRENGRRYDRHSVETRGRRSLILNLKEPRGREIALALIEKADALIEGFRPGVMERLGLGPRDAFVRNPKLVHGRLTGFGQRSEEETSELQSRDNLVLRLLLA